MKPTLGAFALVISVGWLGARCALPQVEPTDEKILERILPSAVQVVLEQDGRRFRAASGVIMATRPSAAGTECFVLTAGHTVSGSAPGNAVYVILGSHDGRGAKVQAAVLAERDTDSVDLALLKAESDRCRPASMKRAATLGESAWVIGFPWGQRVTLARGVVSQIGSDDSGDGNRASQLMVDASVSYGTSGAGVYAARTGSLIGVVEGYNTARVSSQGGAEQWYIDVPVPGQTLVTSLGGIRRFLEETGHADLLRDSFPSNVPVARPGK